MKFKSIVLDLLSTGLTQKQVGALCGRTQGWVGMVISGSINREPPHDVGELLLKAHRRLCKRAA